MAGQGHLIVSHLRLRRVLGVISIALPFVLMLWGFALSGWSMKLQDSISAYYSLRTRDAFVGTLVVIGLFLFTYRGYERRDDVAGYLACVFALGVAFFPNKPQGWESIVHFSSAAGLFLVLSFFSLILFTKTKKVELADLKSVMGYVDNLRSVLDKGTLQERKAFIRSFVRSIKVTGDDAKLSYLMPVPPEWLAEEKVRVLYSVRYGGAEGTRTPDFLRAREALSQLSYSPLYQEYDSTMIARKDIIFNLPGIIILR